VTAPVVVHRLRLGAGLLFAACLIFWGGEARAAAPVEIQGIRLGDHAGAAAAATRLVVDLSGPVEILVRIAPGQRQIDILLLGSAAAVPFRPGSVGLVRGATVREIGRGATLVSVQTKDPAAIGEIMLLGADDHGVHGAIPGDRPGTANRLVLDLVRAAPRATGGGIFALPWARNPAEATRLANMHGRGLGAAGQRAQADTGQAQLSVEELTKRRDALFEKMISDLTNLDVAFEFAAVSTQLGDYEGAIVAYERLLIINPDLPRVRYELGVLYFALKSYPASQTYLESVLQLADAPPDLQQQANALLQQIAVAKTRNVFLGNVTLGMRYQSDANSAPGSATLRILGNDVRLQGPGTSRSDWNGFANAYFRDTYALDDGDDAPLWESNATLYGTRQILVTSLDLTLVQVTSGIRFHPVSGDGLTIRPHVITGVIGLADNLYSDQYGAGIDFTRPLTAKLTLDGTIDSSHREFHNFGPNTTLRLQTGEDSGIVVRNRYLLAADQTAGFDVGFRHGSAQSIFNVYSSYTVAAMYQLTFAPPLDQLELPWAVVLNGARVWSEYGGPDPSVDPGVTRHDREWRVSATLAVPFTPVLSTFVQLQSSHINSTLPNNAYENVSLLMGVTRSF
jgi:hypothetical protein